MEQCDVLIVGGGPAGATAARALVTSGLDVVVLDKKPFPRDKVCAGWVTPPVWEALELNPRDYAAAGNVLQPINRFRTSLLGGQDVETGYDEVVSYAIRRVEFDHFLLQRSGARLRLGEGVEKIERVGKRWRINDAIEAALLIGAGGHACPVARLLGAELGSGPGVVAAMEIEFKMSEEEAARCPVVGDRPELFFCTELDGYGWVVRKGDYLNVGLGREQGLGVAHEMTRFRDMLTGAGKLPPSTPEKFKGHAYLLYPQPEPRPIFADGVLTIGDASGLAYAQSGEGIRPAVESALLAARTIVQAQGDYSHDRLRAYEQGLEQRFGKRKAYPVAVRFIPAAIKHGIAKWLLGSALFTRRVLLDRWFLHR
ncbi:MAG TPA: NAD(P)/FAD-dependent oxidoreductase [Gammaproteobacteria bacterium]